MKGVFSLAVLMVLFLIELSLSVQHGNTSSPQATQHCKLVKLLDDCCVQQVMVFNDCAEVTCLVSLASLQPGTCVLQLSTCIIHFVVLFFKFLFTHDHFTLHRNHQSEYCGPVPHGQL
jgi:hypothetical protein